MNQSNQYQENILPQDHDDSFDDIDFKRLLTVVLKFRWQIIAFTIVVGLFTTIYAYSLTPIYRAAATLHLDSDNSEVDSLNDVYRDYTAGEEYYYTQLEIIRSKAVAELVVKNLALDKNPLFRVDKQQWLVQNPNFIGLSDDELEARFNDIQYNRALGYVRGGLGASPIKQTQLVSVSFTSAHPEMTALISNAVGQAYIDNHMQVSLERIEKSATWLNASLSGLKTQLDTSEDKLQAFQEKESLIDIGGIKSLAANEVESLSEQVLAAKQLLKRTEIIYNLYQQYTSIDDIANLPEVLNHPAIKSANQQTRQVEERIDELALTYGKKHPKMISAVADLAREKDNVNKNIRRLKITIGNDYKKAQRALAQQEFDLAEAKANYQQLTRKENQRRELTQEVDTNKELYNSFFARLKETSELEGFEATVGRVIERAEVPYSPIKPNKKLIITIAMMTAAALSIGVVLLMEALNSTIRNVTDIETRLGTNLLGIVPLIKHDGKKSPADQSIDHHYFFNADDHAFSEAIRTLRTSVQLLSFDKKIKVIAITSTIPNEGKTMVTSNLAFAVGQLEKTILIDTDLRKPKVGKNFGIQSTGLSDYIAGNNSLEECIQHDSKSNLDVITAGTIPPNPQELLASNQFKQLLKELRAKYDKIIIDTPPILAVSDAMIVARQADNLIYVVNSDSTKESQIKTSLKRLQQAKLNISGVVLNKVDLDKAAEYDDFQGYYDRYGYNS
ncbi:polysaccharide biosynthesis tyrosine autokinase [Thalassotalea nanhaiensis]|uniref:non-specific protein-tyrosine kinase n=1 Tax=Thalassotalea nanhaiensis TaxID=3065648 RepID=A0ABY9TPH3_9GAMM|nr:polysaccharide biosynthesis tyrosine autokinase [Colwelliaceae bacterium SQ345]